MDELLERLVGKVGVERDVAEKAVGIILTFLLEEGASDQVQTLINRLPGADAAIEAVESEGGLGMGGIMGVGSKLMAAGLGFDQMQCATHELIDFARQKVGPETVDAIVKSVPAIGQFV